MSAEVNYGIRFAVEAEFDAFLQQLCAEVHSRLTEIRHRGKSITLKLMVRSVDAPVETAKFMGHGVCDHVTKTSTLADFTGDAETIRRTVFAIKNGMGVDPRELRGVGIQIGKLDGGCGDKIAPPSRLKAMFEVAAKKSIVLRKPQNEVESNVNQLQIAGPEEKPVHIPLPKAKRGRKRGGGNSSGRAIGRGTTKQPSVTDLLAGQAASNAESEIDMEVLAELPDHIREEALRDFRRNQQTSKRQKLIMPVAIVPSADEDATSGLDQDFLAALPGDIRAELLREQTVRKHREQRQAEEVKFRETVQIDEAGVNTDGEKITVLEQNQQKEGPAEGNIFMRDDWRRLLQDWVDSVDGPANQDEGGPAQCDIDTVTSYAVELVRLRMINDLYLRIRYFFR